jgi:methionyl-tRNA formyltransferase
MKILVISDNTFIKEKIIEIFKSKNTKCDLFESKDLNFKNNLFIDYLISEYKLIISAHCKKIFPKKLVESTRCINLHPGYNPYNRGWFPQVFSILNKLPLGATIHEMDEGLDSGDIIFQEEVPISNSDDSLSLYNKVLQKEINLFQNNFDKIIEGSYKKTRPKSKGNLNLKKDFDNLCKLDLNNIGTMGEHIDLLRALSHGDFENAYFLDKENKKIKVKIELKK